MPWNNAAMLTDKDGNFIPQLWDPSQNKFIPWDGKVQQSGTVPSREEIIFARAIRSTSAPWINVPVPAGAKGVKLYATVYGATGTFTTEQGLALSVADINPSDSFYPTVVGFATARSRGAANYEHPALFLYPGLTDAVVGLVVMKGVPLGARLRLTLSINGTFATGEGFDCSLVALWLF